MNNIILPSLFFTSCNTAFSLSSNSPLYFAPATKAPISSEKIVQFFNPSGTSPLTILIANPSAIAVLPTPGSPIKHGLFFVFLERILITFLISSSLPITGSNFCFLASSTKSVPYFFKASYVSSGLSLVTLVFPLTSNKTFKKLFLSILKVLNNCFNFELALSISPSIICSTDTYSSFILSAVFSASASASSTSLEIYTCSICLVSECILGLLSISFLTVFWNSSPTFIFFSSSLIKLFSPIKSAYNKCSCSIWLFSFSITRLCAF